MIASISYIGGQSVVITPPTGWTLATRLTVEKNLLATSELLKKPSKTACVAPEKAAREIIRHEFRVRKLILLGSAFILTIFVIAIIFWGSS